MLLHPEIITAYRQRTFRLNGHDRLRSPEEAVDYVIERGFIFFWPITGIPLPSLWTAAAGDRPVADEHDDPGHVTWGWKDSLLGKKVWYYAKVLRKKATIISLDLLPYFYALTENYGSPEEDYLTLYEQGRLTQESKLVYEALLKDGPLDTIELRNTTHLTSRESDSRFNRALTDLQAGFQILPVGVTQSGRWHYAYAYDIVNRHFPDLIDRTRFIGEREARARLAETYLQSLGAVQLRDLSRLFGWTSVEVEKAVEDLRTNGKAVKVDLENEPGEWWAVPDLAGESSQPEG